MFKEKRFVNFDTPHSEQSLSEAAAEGRKEKAEREARKQDPKKVEAAKAKLKAQEEKAKEGEAKRLAELETSLGGADMAIQRAETSTKEFDKMFPELKEAIVTERVQAKEKAATSAGLLARLDALEADKIVSPLATKEWRAIISSPDFKSGNNVGSRIIARVEQLEMESAKVEPVAPKDGIDVDKLAKVEDGELDTALAAIPDKKKVGAKDPLADYAEFFPKKNNAAATPNSAPEPPSESENEVSDEALKKQNIAVIETTHKATGQAIADLEARVVESRQAFKDAMSSPEGRKDLMLRVKEADFKNMEAALQALKTNYDSEGQALAIIKNSSSERFDVNVNAFADLNSSIQKGMDTVVAQLSEANEANNEVARKLQAKAQDQAEAEARVAANQEFQQKEALRLAEEKLQAEAAKFKIELGHEEDFDATAVPAEVAVESDPMAGLRLNEPGMGHIILIKIKETTANVNKLRDEVAKLQEKEQTEEIQAQIVNKKEQIVALNRVLSDQKEKFADLQKPAKTTLNRDKYVAEMEAQGVPEGLRNDRTMGNQLVRWKGRLDAIDNPVTIKALGTDFAQFTEKARGFLEKDGSFGLYIAQLDTFISRASELKKANPDLGEIINRYRKAIIDTAIAESKSKTAPSLEGSKLEEVGREFTRLALTIDELTKLKGKIGDDEYTKLRSSLATNTAEGQKEINEKYTRIHCHEKLAEYADKGYISKDLSERYASSDDWIQLALALRLVEEKLPEFKAAKDALMAAVNAGYINDDEAKRIASATITDTPYLTDRANYHSSRIANIKALEEKVRDNPGATGSHLDMNALKKAAYVEYTDAAKLKEAVDSNPANPDALVMIELAKKAELGAFRAEMEGATKGLKAETVVADNYLGMGNADSNFQQAPEESLGIDSNIDTSGAKTKAPKLAPMAPEKDDGIDTFAIDQSIALQKSLDEGDMEKYLKPKSLSAEDQADVDRLVSEVKGMQTEEKKSDESIADFVAGLDKEKAEEMTFEPVNVEQAAAEAKAEAAKEMTFTSEEVAAPLEPEAAPTPAPPVANQNTPPEATPST